MILEFYCHANKRSTLVTLWNSYLFVSILIKFHIGEEILEKYEAGTERVSLSGCLNEKLGK